MIDDAYSTIGTAARAELKVQGSRFLALSFPVSAREDAIGRWKSIKKEYHDATHHCYAYRLGREGLDFRSSDDGEPSGTAGRPILSAIDRRGLSDVLVVVVRYFGGTKLGMGGLARAYAEAAETVLAVSAPETRYAQEVLHIAFDHALTPRIMRAADAAGATVAGSEYGECARLALAVRASRVEALRTALVNATSGAVRFEDEKVAGSPKVDPGL